MRTTLDIDEDVLLVAKEVAEQQGISKGKALSQLAREALTRQAAIATRNGVPLFPRQPDAEVVTLEIVNELRDGLS
ncbi:MAG: CopG family transcriptional regulator [Anaerolineae bacterium SG8_19]|nr:MAG: CopG family transcriptional regulator [Anaerolineae bacterium SG8_19]